MSRVEDGPCLSYRRGVSQDLSLQHSGVTVELLPKSCSKVALLFFTFPRLRIETVALVLCLPGNRILSIDI